MQGVCYALALAYIINVLFYWGLPFGTYTIYFWSIPYIIFLVCLLAYTKIKPFLILILLVVLVSLSQFFSMDKKEIIGVVSSEINLGIGKNTLANLGKEAIILNEKTALKRFKNNTKKSTWFFIAPLSSMFSEEMITAFPVTGDFFIFGEHDNLNNFTNKNKTFNSDAYKRQTPWHLYKPIMTSWLKSYANLDKLFCSNLGCTIKNRTDLYPLIWDYDSYGFPIILGAGTYNWKQRITYIGDSDPVVDYLASYNAYFINELFKTHIGLKIYLILSIPLLYVILFSKNTPKNLSFLIYSIYSILMIIISLGISLPDMVTKTDVNVISDGEWLNPHYEFHWSSMPKSLVSDGNTVSIDNRYNHSGKQVYIFTHHDQKFLPLKLDQPTIIFMMPKSCVSIGSQKYCCDDNPLGTINTKIGRKPFIIIDARIIRCNAKESTYFRPSEKTIIVGTNSPQLNYKLIKLLNE